MTTGGRRSGARVIWVLAIALAVLHQDVWLWGDRSLVFGFLPAGLAYHAAYSIAAATLWACAVRFAWPSWLEAWAEGKPGAGGEGGS